MKPRTFSHPSTTKLLCHFAMIAHKLNKITGVWGLLQASIQAQLNLQITGFHRHILYRIPYKLRPFDLELNQVSVYGARYIYVTPYKLCFFDIQLNIVLMSSFLSEIISSLEDYSMKFVYISHHLPMGTICPPIVSSLIHSTNTRHKSDLYPPSIKLTKYQKAVNYSGIKIFSHLPQNIKNLSWNVNNLN
jgi:hypothetical protein